jgi:hypothetical protein
MERRARLIVERAQELFKDAEPGSQWINPDGSPTQSELKIQAKYLSLAEHQLQREGVIETVDQS